MYDDQLFDDLFNQTSQYMDRFLDSVRDEFGQAIVEDVFEPMLQDISGLQQLSEFFRARMIEMDQIVEELLNGLAVKASDYE